MSTKKQDLHRQIHALTTYGIPADSASGDGKRLYVDKLTGMNLGRQGWLELRPRIRAGDVLKLSELDRFGRSQTEMAKVLLLFLGQVEEIYKNERVAPACPSGKTTQTHTAAREGPGREVRLRDSCRRVGRAVRRLAGDGVPDRQRAPGQEQRVARSPQPAAAGS